MSEQTLILLREELLTQCLLDECPVLVNCLVLLSHLRIGCLLCLVFCKELLQSVHVEATCLLVEERSLLKHRVSTLGKNLLELSVCYSKTELVCLVLYEFGLNVCVPNHVLDLIELVFVEVLLSLLHLDDFCVLVNKFLELCYVDFLAQHFAYLLMFVSAFRVA